MTQIHSGSYKSSPHGADRGVVENGIDHGGINSETGSDVPVDLDLQGRTGALLIARDVGQLGERLQFLEQNGHPAVKFVNAVLEDEEFGFSLSPVRDRVAKRPPQASP
jgi:hypothetical protein